MNDNFDLRKFLVESKAIENMNPIFRKLNENTENTTAETTETPKTTTTEPLTENTLRAKIREMILAELEGEELEDATKRAEKGDSTDLALHMAGIKEYDLNEDDLFEAKKKEEDVEDMPAEDEEIDLGLDAEPATPEDELNMAAAGATGDSKEMIDHLMKALDNAKASGNEKLVTQVLNTLKFAIDQSIVD